MCHKYALVTIHKLYFQKILYFRSSPSQSAISLCLMLPLDNKNETKKLLKWLFLGLNSTPRHPPVYRLLSMSSLRWGGDVVSRPVAAIGWRTVRQKKYSWRHLFPRKKKKRNSPHQCERRRQTSAQSCGSHWLAVCTKSNSNHFTHNTPTNPKGVHAASSITPPLSHRFKPHAGAQHLTFIRADVVSLKAAGLLGFERFYPPGRWSVLSFIISPGGNQEDKELYTRWCRGKFYFYLLLVVVVVFITIISIIIILLLLLVLLLLFIRNPDYESR